MGTFGQRLRELRNQRGISQNELSKYIGVSKSSVNMYERDEREPGFETLEAIADFFNVNMDYLLGREPKQPPMYGSPKLDNLVGKFDPTQFSISARPTLINLFTTLAYPDSPDYAENLAQIQREMQECFTLSDLKHFVAFFNELNTVLTEISEDPGCAEQTLSSDAPETPPEGE